VEEQAETTEEVIAQLTEAHTHQMETLIKSTTEAIKEMRSLVKGYNTQAKTSNSDSEEKKKKCKDKCNKFWDTPICKHCDKKHPSKPEDKYWACKDCCITPCIPEINEKHLKVRGALIRNRDVATGKSATQ
jgi:hypothetical protein